MRAARLHFPDGSPTKAWYCPACDHAHQNEDQAEACCQCRRCGVEHGKSYAYLCAACEKAERNERDVESETREAAKLEARIAKAGPLLPTDTHVFRDDKECDSHGGFGDVDHVIEIAEDDDEPGTHIVLWAADPVGPNEIREEWLVEQLTSDMHEEAGESLVDLNGLVKMIDEWRAKQPTLSYEPNYARCLVYVVGGGK